MGVGGPWKDGEKKESSLWDLRVGKSLQIGRGENTFCPHTDFRPKSSDHRGHRGHRSGRSHRSHRSHRSRARVQDALIDCVDVPVQQIAYGPRFLISGEARGLLTPHSLHLYLDQGLSSVVNSDWVFRMSTHSPMVCTKMVAGNS